MFTLNALDQDHIDNQDMADKETNTECVFLQPSASPRKSGPLTDSVSALVKRSQTFSPSAPINKSDYNCRVSSKRRKDDILIHNNLGLFFAAYSK